MRHEEMMHCPSLSLILITRCYFLVLTPSKVAVDFQQRRCDRAVPILRLHHQETTANSRQLLKSPIVCDTERENVTGSLILLST